MLRRIFYAAFYSAASFSALLLLASLILWPVSYHRLAEASYTTGWGMNYSVGCHSGRARVRFVTAGTDRGPNPRSINFVAGNLAPYNEDHWSYLTWNRLDSDLGPVKNYFGVGWLSVGSFHIHDWLIDSYIPFSYLAVLFAILPTLAWRSVRRRRKAARVGLCPQCGYDLRAHVPSQKCPECGSPVTSKNPTGAQ